MGLLDGGIPLFRRTRVPEWPGVEQELWSM